MYFSPSGGNSWADRVKGIPPSPKTSEGVKETPEKHELHPVLPSPPVLSPVPSSLTESLDSFKEIIGEFCIKAKKKNMCGSGNPTYPKCLPPTLNFLLQIPKLEENSRTK